MLLTSTVRLWFLALALLFLLARAQEDDEDNNNDDNNNDNNDDENNDNNDDESSDSSSSPEYVGTLSMVTPDPVSSASILKIIPSSTFTLEWNYTNVVDLYESITWRAICSANDHTYDIATLDGDATSYEWDIAAAEETQDRPWADATYALAFCGEGGATSIASPGGLQAATAASIMMYRPASYTPLDEWECVACKSDAERNWPSTTLATILVSMISCVLGGIMLVGRTPE